METRYPSHIYDFQINEMDLLYKELYKANCTWPGDDDTHVKIVPREHAFQESMRKVDETSPPKFVVQATTPGVTRDAVGEETTTKFHIGRLFKRSQQGSRCSVQYGNLV